MKGGTKTRSVGWWFDTKGCVHHYFKNVWEWRYDDLQKANVHINIGIMAMDDFGDLFVIGGGSE